MQERDGRLIGVAADTARIQASFFPGICVRSQSSLEARKGTFGLWASLILIADGTSIAMMVNDGLFAVRSCRSWRQGPRQTAASPNLSCHVRIRVLRIQQ